jgi:HAD superfamily hydrolase (TIGR01456 family)
MSTVIEESSSDSEEERRQEAQGQGLRRNNSSGLIAAVVKERKLSLNIRHKKHKQINFGICFDIDGVLARGTVAIPAAQAGFQKLMNEQKKFKYPVAFVTNALNTNQDKANQLSSWFGIEISKDQMIQSPSPLEMFEEYHNKFCLCVGQGKMIEIAKDLGLKKLCTIEDVAAARPLLDVINHENRKKIDPNFVNKEFTPIEAILLLGEPKHWESSLQIIIDLLVTHGHPDNEPETTPKKHLPVIACNMDLRFMERSHMPRFGHGAFLVCLEALYQKVTGTPLQYKALLGKPSEVTYRFAEHVLAREAIKLGYHQSLKTMYLIGDNPMSDIVGSNLYQRYIDRMKSRRRRISVTQQHETRADPELPHSRNFPPAAKFLPQSVDTMESILVCTGVYNKGDDPEGDGTFYHGHRDFPQNTELHLPTFICEDADEAIDYILLNEDIM